MRTIALAFAIAAAIAIGGGSAQAQNKKDNITCTGTVGGGGTATQINGVWTGAPTQINGNITVPKGATCTLNFVNVTGNVQVQSGGTLLIDGYNQPSTISGNIGADQCVSTLIQGNVTVNGNVAITNCTGAATNGFQGPGVTINGNFACDYNAGPCEVWLGKITKNAEVQSNKGMASDVSLTEIGGNLTCLNNVAAPTHSHGVNWVTGNTGAQCGSGFSTTTTLLGVPPSGGMTCAALASLPATGFPVPNMVITSTSVSGTGASQRCLVNLTYNPTYVSELSNCAYADKMQVAMPATGWNGRFFYQTANGGSDNPGAGAITGYATATDNSGIDAPNTNNYLTACGNGDKNQYFADPQGARSNALTTQQITSLVAKYIIAEYYGQEATTSYTGGCSGPGRQTMMLSQIFPQYYDGIWVGAPGINFQRTQLAQVWNVEQVLNAYVNGPYSPQPPQTVANDDTTETPAKLLYQVFPPSDRTLFMTALLQACDKLDGVADGVIDNPGACQAAFDPATASYYVSNLDPTQPLVSHPLQCPGVKDATCLSAAQVNVIKAWVAGPKNSSNQPIVAPSKGQGAYPASTTVLGWPYDGGWGSSGGVFPRFVGNAPTPPALPTFKANAPLVYSPDWGFFVYGSLYPPQPMFDPTLFNFDTQMGLLAQNMDWSTWAGSLDLSKFANLGHKIIWYFGSSDSQHNLSHQITYYNELTQLFGSDQLATFARMYLIPGETHCGGGAGTDQHDFLPVLVNWVENRQAPAAVTAMTTSVATPSNPAPGFSSTNLGGVTMLGNNSQAVGGTGAPIQRSRPLCPYPQEVRFTGATTMVNGAPVATTPSDLANPAKYACVAPGGP